MAAPSGTQKPTLPIVDVTSQPADGERRDPPHALDMDRFRRLNSLVHRENVDPNELLHLVEKHKYVNLMNDPLLSFVIACKKPKLAILLIAKISDDRLTDSNYDGDTALHVAAAMDDQEVATELIRRVPNLVHVRNQKQEIPLHKAALYGLQDMFWLLVDKKSSPDARREDGATMLHCAIMGNARALALQIAQNYPSQIASRNEHALTPLQLLVTIPEAFRSQVVLGALDSFIYDWIPLEEDSSKTNKSDEEVAPPNRSSIGVAQDDNGDRSRRAFRSKFPSNYSTLFDLLEFINIPAGWILRFAYNIIRQLSLRVQLLERKKKNHTETMRLIEYLAQEGYFEFFVRGKDPTQDSSTFTSSLERDAQVGERGPPVDPPPETAQEGAGQGRDTEASSAVKEIINRMADKLYKLVSEEPETPVSTAFKEAAQSVEKVLKALSPSSEERWNEPPLIVGAQMGLHDFVGKIVRVCPQSATYLDTKGRDIVQVAVMYRRGEIVKIIRDMRTILPSWLFSRVDPTTGNTILHLASGGSPDAVKEEQDEPDAMQLHYDLVWFEMVESIIPKELVFRRNREGKTAQELFTSSHKRMRNSCKHQLVGIAKTCTSATAAVVFAMSSSFTHKDDPKTSDSPVFKALSYTYVIGLSLAATSLFLLLSLVNSSYKEQEFRRAIPTKFFLARLTYNMALGTLLLAFTFNTFLQIYGVEGKKEKHLIILFMLEIIGCPVLTCFLLFFFDDKSMSRRYI